MAKRPRDSSGQFTATPTKSNNIGQEPDTRQSGSDYYDKQNNKQDDSIRDWQCFLFLLAIIIVIVVVVVFFHVDHNLNHPHESNIVMQELPTEEEQAMQALVHEEWTVRMREMRDPSRGHWGGIRRRGGNDALE
ncbi:hypothetical protein ACEQ8H_008394 [Pleosporales sp. CAS-2024a]